jgi:hypothetical protein
MKYSKPEIVALAKAVAAIQGVKNGARQDSVNIHLPLQTAAAYEADE